MCAPVVLDLVLTIHGHVFWPSLNITARTSAVLRGQARPTLRDWKSCTDLMI